MYIDGIGISGYRSFGEEIQEIGPFSKINLFVGQNNSGKSNILSFLTKHYRQFLRATVQNEKVSFDALDYHKNLERSEIRLSYGIKKGGEKYKSIVSKQPKVQNLVERFFNSKPLSNGKDMIWFRYEPIGRSQPLQIDESILKDLKSEEVFGKYEWRDLWHGLTKQGAGDLNAHWIPETLNHLYRHNFATPEISLIPAIRRIGDSGSNPDDYSGIGIINRLAQLQNPSHSEQHLKLHFEEINQFLRKIVGSSTAQLEIPYERDVILVHMDNRTLPLSSLGTGIHEVIILASAATVLREQILCIEEPELHLHPLLQRKLLQYLNAKTDNQYFFTTHSAHLLDTPGAAIFHLRHQNGATTVDPVYTAAAKSLVCVDLGYRASDLLQANCVIWVEGPSDRIYLNHWITAFDPKLIEGIHYSIMFYGGRLLSHLSAEDPEVTEFISLRRLNRYISIVIDSDRPKRGALINRTKQRVRDEFNKGPGFAWITQGREIENYIQPSTLEAAVKEVHKSAAKLTKIGQYDNSLHYKTTAGKLITKDIDKVKIAHVVVKSPADFNVLDLKQRISKLVEFIRESNDSDDF
jgi:predicted ATP-dependent endonuclease of OLD family